MARRKPQPELELPGIISKAIAEYLGTPQMNRMNSEQRTAIMNLAQTVGSDVGMLVEEANRKSKGEQPT